MEFVINMEPEQVEEARQALAGLGVRFNPREDLRIIWDEADTGTVTTPGNADAITEILNQYLADEQAGTALADPPDSLTLTELEDLLIFGRSQFNRDGGRDGESLLLKEGQSCLDTVRELHPLLHNRLTPIDL